MDWLASICATDSNGSEDFVAAAGFSLGGLCFLCGSEIQLFSSNCYPPKLMFNLLV